MAKLKSDNRVTTEPYQKLSVAKKTKEWREQNVDAYIGKSSFGSGVSSGRKKDMKIAYDLYNSIFDESDFKHITDPFKASESFPASLQDFNIIKPKIDLLKGEETKRPFPFKVIQTNEEATSRLQEKYKEMLMDTILDVALGADPNAAVTEEDIDKVDMVSKYMSKDFSDIAEQQAYHSLNYLREKEDMKTKFLLSFHDLLCANTEIGYIGSINGDPIYERVNPLEFSCDTSIESGYIEEGDWAVRRMRMTAPAIYDRFYDIMDEKDLNELLEMFNYDGAGSVGGSKEAPSGIFWKDLPTSSEDGEFHDSTTDVWHVTWKSLKKVGFLTTIDEEGNEYTDVVDESYKPDEDEEIYWDWVSEIWEGYRIGNDMYVGIQPIANQNISLDNPNSVILPYVGTIFNNMNTESKSLVEIMKPLQYLYIAIMYQLQLLIARDKGKVITVDVTQIPKSLGIDTNKWLHLLSSTNVNFINPYECLEKGTKAMMADGSIRNIEDIKVGDEVMGPDGKPRLVLHTHEGVDKLYKLKHRSGAKDHVVNSAHPNYYFEKDYYKKEYKPLLKNALELLKENSDNPYKSKLRYTKRATNVDSNWDRDVKLDPYFLGLWLGDGKSTGIEIYNKDLEVISWLEGYAKEYNLKCSVTYENPNSDVTTIRLFRGEGLRNPVKNILNHYKVFGNKDIPEDYIYTNRENRLRLLAGLIDTDGYYSERDKIYTFSQSEDRKHIVEKAAFIARSLGFKVSVNKYGETHEKYICNSDNISICQPTWVMSILDWDIKIPTLIERKQAECPTKKGDKDFSHFEIEYKGIGEFYGIHIDGDNLFLLDDFTIVHNTGWDIPGREGGKPAQFNQISSQDLSTTQSIVQYINLMHKIEEMVGELSGVSRQRQGQVQSSELVGNVQQTIVQSSHITEYLYYTHTQFKKRVFTKLLDSAKSVWANSGKEKIHYLTDDMVRVFMDITDDFLYSDMDIFVSDSTKEHQNVEALRQLALPAMQTGASLLDIAEMYTSENLTDIKSKLKDMERAKKQREDEMQRMQQETQAQATQVQAQIEQQRMSLEQAKLQAQEADSIRKADTQIQVALIQADSKEAIDASKQSLEIDKLGTEYAAKEFENRMEERKLQEDIRSNKAEEAIKRMTANKTQNTSN
jgi:hypothetical protein